MTEVSIARACTACGTVQAYPRPVCQTCHGKAFASLAIPAMGTIYGMTTVWRAPNPELAGQVPYVIALVRAAPGGLLMLRLSGYGDPPRTGDAVRIDQAAGPYGLAAYPA